MSRGQDLVSRFQAGIKEPPTLVLQIVIGHEAVLHFAHQFCQTVSVDRADVDIGILAPAEVRFAGQSRWPGIENGVA